MQSTYPLALNTFWCFPLISTKYAAVIAIALNADHILDGSGGTSVGNHN